ncbi:XRE family transcriptional regulator [Bacillus sp. JJ1764]|uniref:XRE family transcriptional regulator n=1 Tax=Bacillus sp. JJ1764 TaxID=3122964 RepID=UPI002FFFA8EB
MHYSELLKSAIINADLSLAQISRRLKRIGFKADKGYLSKLQNGKTAPAGDRLNEGLALILNVDPLELKAAAYREKIPTEVLQKLRETYSA